MSTRMIQSRLIVGDNQKQQEIIKQISQKYLHSVWPKPHPDLLIIEGKTSIKIEQIRELKKKLALKPYSAPLKLVVICQAEKLTLPAQNALLKTLEEPPANSLLVLCVSHLDLLLPTIVSRCQLTKLSSLPQIKLNQKQIISHRKLLSQILKSGVGERLKLAVLWSQNKNEALDLVKSQLFTLRQSMLTKPALATAQNINQAQKALKRLEANTNPSLTLGNLFLTYTPCAKKLN